MRNVSLQVAINSGFGMIHTILTKLKIAPASLLKIGEAIVSRANQSRELRWDDISYYFSSLYSEAKHCFSLKIA